MAKKLLADIKDPKSKSSQRGSPASTAPSVRVFTRWTPDMLRAAERSAEAGYLGPAVTICDWLLTDDRVPAVLDSRIEALLGLDPSFDLGLGRRKRKALKALEADEDFWEAYPESELQQMLRWGILLGGSLHCHNWTLREDHGGRVLPMLSFWHPQTLRYDWNLRQLSVSDSAGANLVVTPGDGRWLLHTPGGIDRFWANGVWRSLSRWVLAKQYAMGDWMRHSGRGTKLVATGPEGATEEQRADLAKQIASSEDGDTIVLAAGFDLDLLVADKGVADLSKGQIDAADTAIAIRIRGGNLTTKVDDKGSFAAAKTQADTGDGAKKRFDATALSTTLHDQSLVYWADLNYGDKRLAPWPVWPVEPEEDKNQRAEMVDTLSDGLTKFDALGYEIRDKELREEFGLSFLGPRTKPDPVLDPAPAPGDEGTKVPSKTGKKPEKTASNRSMMRTRSGIPVMETSGFAEGQVYTDQITDDARAKAATAFSPFIQGLLDVVQASTGYEDLRQRVLAKYADSASPEELRDILLKAMVLGDMAGAAAVRQDA